MLAVQTRRLWGGTISPMTGSDRTTLARLDAASRRWVEQLRLGHPRRLQTVESLHAVLRRVAVFELSRRRRTLGWISGPEFDDLAHQAADDALVNVLDKLDQFRGRSRFTTWAYKFVVFEVSDKVARHAWLRQPPADGLAWDKRPGPLALRPEERLEQQAQLDALSRAIGELTARQREVFVSIALNDVPIDVVAVKLGSTATRSTRTCSTPGAGCERGWPQPDTPWATASCARPHRGRVDAAMRDRR